MKFLFHFILTIIVCSYSCGSKGMKSGIPEIRGLPESTDSAVFHLSENQKKILAGAKKCLEEKFGYDFDMAYHVLMYRDGTYIGEKVYPAGDLDPKLGVCTDLIIRALRYAGVADLQEAVHTDLLSNWSDYPMKRWGARKPDTNIDHRRVPNLLVWFGKQWGEPGENDFSPGDVVVWDMNEDSWADHMGIVSDSYENDRFCVIHNFPSPGYVAEEDVLNRWKIAGHFRINY
jgi:uncharacterized protein YijF (DUF1287 family)